MENLTETPILSPKGTFPASIAKIIDDYKLVINRGEANGIREGQRMLVYRVSNEDIKDPHTGESLGYLELVRGTGKIIFIQEKISILESDRTADRRRINDIINFDIQQRKDRLEREMCSPEFSRSPDTSLKFPALEQLLKNDLIIPFDNPQVGDKVKPI